MLLAFPMTYVAEQGISQVLYPATA